MFGFGKKSDFPTSKLIPLIVKLGEFLKEGYEHKKNHPLALDAETLSVFIDLRMKEWNPELGGKKLLDPDTKTAAARFVAGIACNMLKKEES